MCFKKKELFNRPLKVLLFTNSLILLSGAMFAPIYALYVEEIGGDLLDAGLTAGMFALAAGITTLASGKLSDKVKENELIVVLGYTIIGTGFLLYTICYSIWFLLFIQILIGLGEAIYSPAFDAVYSKHIDKNRAGKQWGAWESINYFSLAFGAFIGSVVVTLTSFKFMFILMAIMSYFSAVYIYRLPRKLL